MPDQRSRARVSIQSRWTRTWQGCAQTRIDNHNVTPVSNATITERHDYVNIVEHHFDARCGLFFRSDGRILGNFWAKQLLAGSVLFVDVAEVVGLP